MDNDIEIRGKDDLGETIPKSELLVTYNKDVNNGLVKFISSLDFGIKEGDNNTTTTTVGTHQYRAVADDGKGLYYSSPVKFESFEYVYDDDEEDEKASIEIDRIIKGALAFGSPKLSPKSAMQRKRTY